jgi:hypothetical protein
MTISASCPACGVPLRLPDDAAGRTFACVGCGRWLATEDGGKLVVRSGNQPEVRPYQPPGYVPPAYTPYAPTAGYVPRPLTRDEAAARAQGPGVLLMVYGFLWGLSGLLLPLLLLNEEVREEEFGQPLVAIGAAFSIAMGAFTIFSGLRLLALRSFTLVMLCIVLNIALGVLGCWLMAQPAIWPLVVILDGKVKPHFRA